MNSVGNVRLQPPLLELGFYKHGTSRTFDEVLSLVRARGAQTLRTEASGVLLSNVISGTDVSTRGYVAFSEISTEARAGDSHPVEILINNGFVSDLPHTGLLAYELFRSTVESVSPDYAAITVELWLPSPEDLRLDPDAKTLPYFTDFYLRGGYLSDRSLDTVFSLYAAAYVEPMAEGHYISTTAQFNPRGVDVAARLSKSAEVATLLGNRKRV